MIRANGGKRPPVGVSLPTVIMRQTPDGCRSRQRSSLGAGHRGYTTTHWQPMHAITHAWVLRLEPGPLHGGNETTALSARQPLNALAAICHQLMLYGAFMGQLTWAPWASRAQPRHARHATHERRRANRLSGLVISRPRQPGASTISYLASWCNG